MKICFVLPVACILPFSLHHRQKRSPTSPLRTWTQLGIERKLPTLDSRCLSSLWRNTKYGYRFSACIEWALLGAMTVLPWVRKADSLRRMNCNGLTLFYLSTLQGMWDLAYYSYVPPRKQTEYNFGKPESMLLDRNTAKVDIRMISWDRGGIHWICEAYWNSGLLT